MVSSLDISCEIARHLNLAPPPRDNLVTVELFLRTYDDLYLAARDGRGPT
jgi:hypothetical protein